VLPGSYDIWFKNRSDKMVKEVKGIVVISGKTTNIEAAF